MAFRQERAAFLQGVPYNNRCIKVGNSFKPFSTKNRKPKMKYPCLWQRLCTWKFVYLTNTIKFFIMRKICLILFAILISTLSYSQLNWHSGVSNGLGPLFDSGGVALSVKEYSFDSCGITKRQIYRCDFTFKNSNSYPVILKHYDFYTENVTDSINNVGCDIKRVSSTQYSDTLAAKSTKIVAIYGETPGTYQPAGTPVNKGCFYHWKFSGFMPFKK